MDVRHDDNELYPIINHFFVESSPVNKGFGIKIKSLDPSNPQLEMEMSDDLIGLIYDPMLHGGVIAAVLDAVGSLAVFLDIIGKMKSGSAQEKVEEFRKKSKLNTIDLRVDYLRPGKGKVFTASSSILRTGKKVGVSRMELHNEKQHLIAVGTGTYIVA